MINADVLIMFTTFVPVIYRLVYKLVFKSKYSLVASYSRCLRTYRLLMFIFTLLTLLYVDGMI